MESELCYVRCLDFPVPPGHGASQEGQALLCRPSKATTLALGEGTRRSSLWLAFTGA